MGGIFGVGGVIAFLAGGLILTTIDDPEFQVSRWLILVMAAVIAVFFASVVAAMTLSP